MFYYKSFLTGKHVLLEGMYSRRACLTVLDVLLEYIPGEDLRFLKGGLFLLSK